MGYSAYSVLRGNKAREVLQTARITYFRSGVLPWLVAPVLIGFTITLAYGLQKVAPAFMKVGWIALLSSDDKSTNIGFSALTSLHGSDGPLVLLLGGLVVMLILVLLPTYAETEERIFRRHATSAKSIAIRSLAFGLLHMVMGISLCVALALSFTGVIYALFYNLLWRPNTDPFWEREPYAFQRVTALHSIYNALLILGLGVLILLT